ncbi:MAG TPA: cadherin-like domain-containing protein, partial [Acidimicrobiales bacterium]|nr:cadherin-like domain-containing protein [Acidimicrobiales bacterium]
MPLVRVSGRRSRLAAVLAITAVLAGLATAVPRPALAIHTTGVTAVTAQSFNYYSNVSLFGGPYVTRGYGQDPDIAGAAASASPSASCSTDGATTNVDADGARAAYGPSVIFGGIWPEGNSLAPPSGPLTSGVNCQTGAGGSATASTDVVMMPPGSTWTTPTNPARIEPHPGGVGPSPFYAEEVHTVCSAASDGTMTGTTNIVGGVLETKYDPTTQEPIVTEAVPANPAPNYTKQGTIDHVGDSYEIVFNEQIMNPDGSLTVNGAHMTLLGPTAFGDLVIGSATCDVTVGPLAHVAAPVANDDMYSTSFETPLTVAAPAGVLANDTDADGDPLTAEMPSDPANGSVVLNLDGSFTYTPDAGFSGTDTFTYMVHDPQNQMDTATVTITVNAPSNRPPVANDDTYSTAYETPLTVAAPAGVLANDTDADGDVLTAEMPSDPPNGSVMLNTDGSFTYTPDAGFSGTDTFTYMVHDPADAMDTAVVTITVAGPPNQAPTAADDSYAT